MIAFTVANGKRVRLSADYDIEKGTVLFTVSGTYGTDQTYDFAYAARRYRELSAKILGKEVI